MFWNCLAALLSRCLAEPCLKDINAKLEEEQMMKEVQFMQTNSCGLAMFSGHLWTPCHFASNCHQLQRSKPMAPQRMGEVETAWDVEEAQRWKVVVLCILLQWQDVTGGKAKLIEGHAALQHRVWRKDFLEGRRTMLQVCKWKSHQTIIAFLNLVLVNNLRLDFLGSLLQSCRRTCGPLGLEI